jgi:ABC-2 type transport system permease protein
VTGYRGTLGLLRLALRRDRLRLPVWVLAIVGLTAASASAVATAYPDQKAIDAYADSLGDSPSAIALAGPPIALHTHAGVVLYETLLTMTVGVALMAIFLVNRHTRAEEEEGRTELLRATVVGRHAPGASAMLMALLGSVLVGAGVALAVAAADVPLQASVLLGASVAVLGVVFGAVTLCLAQAFSHGRSTVGAALAFLGIAFVLRAAGDVQENGLVWLSPIGWSQATHPLGANRWWPLAVALVAVVVLLVVALVLADHRDVGNGLVATRPGPPVAAGWLRGPVSLAFVQQRGAIVGWSVGVFLLAAATGSLTREMQSLAADNPQLEEYLQSAGGSLTDSFFASMLMILALLAAGFAVSSALRTRGEEVSGRLEPLLATGLSRTRWLLGSLVVTVGGALAVLVLSGLGLGLSYGLVVSDAGQGLRLAGLSLVYAPSVLVLAAVAVLLVGWLPAVAKAAWAVLAFCFVIGWLGGLLRPPAWVVDLSPFSHMPQVPVEAFTLGAPSWAALSVVLLTGLGVVGLRRRDVH